MAYCVKTKKNKISSAMLYVFKTKFNRKKIRDYVVDKFSYTEYVKLIKQNIDKT